LHPAEIPRRVHQARPAPAPADSKSHARRRRRRLTVLISTAGGGCARGASRTVTVDSPETRRRRNIGQWHSANQIAGGGFCHADVRVGGIQSAERGPSDRRKLERLLQAWIHGA